MPIVLALACRPAPDADPVPAPTVAAISTTPTAPPEPTPPEPPGLEVAARRATSLGTDAFSANGRIQPRGLPTTYHVEYGPTEAYGQLTPTRPLGPKRAAHYTESWDEGLGAWRGGSGSDLVQVPVGGVSGGYARYSEPTGTDYNHMDGIGPLHLVQYFYPGTFTYDYPSGALGGNQPDFRDATVELDVRGIDWDLRTAWPNPHYLPPFARGDELVFWAQTDASPAKDMSHMSNWAHTGYFLTDALFSGDWTHVGYTLEADTNAWTYAGQDRTQMRDLYVYHPLNDVLNPLDVDFFHLMLYIDDYVQLYAKVDFDNLDVTYRNHSVLYPSNGGTLTSEGAGTDPAALTDGWRFGEGHVWRSDPEPQDPVEWIWELADPVVIERVQVHNDPEWPSAGVEVLASLDGGPWTSIVSGVLPESSEYGPNFVHLLWTGLSVPATAVKVRVVNGYHSELWGLGEVEVFGTGATEATDDDWYGVTEDITGLVAGETYHWRLVAESALGTVGGPDQAFTVPTGAVAEVETGAATVVNPVRVRIAGRVNTLGAEGWYAFDLGLDETYGLRTPPFRTGPEIAPRTFTRILELDHPDLAALTSGSTVHWRLGSCAGCGTADTADDEWTWGEDATFVVP